MEKTAVELLEDQYFKHSGNFLEMKKAFEQAKEMEKEQIIYAHINGFYSPPFGKSRNGEAELYYNKTFKSE